MEYLLTVAELAEELQTDANGVRGLATRTRNPLPLMVLKGRLSRGYVLREDFAAWLKAESVPYAERRMYEHEPPRRKKEEEE